MKKLVAPGITLVVTSFWRTVHPAHVRLFPATGYAKHFDSTHDVVGADFTLKSGTRYFYNYNPPLLNAVAIGTANNMQRIGPSLYPPYLGGKLFNRFVRAGCFYKNPTTP